MTHSRPKLLIIELWGLGDLLIATPFIRAASERFDVTVLAKPYAKELQEHFWPGVNVVPFYAPWTAFKHKYRLYRWPWRQLLRLRKQIGSIRFDVGLSARWDPRDHVLLAVFGAKRRLGFPRVGSQLFLTDRLERPDAASHRYEYWKSVAGALRLVLPARGRIAAFPVERPRGEILIHTGAGQPVRVWPLERYAGLARRLRGKGYRVQIACDPEQREWWTRVGEETIATPNTVKELITLVNRAVAFIGNDSGPGHLAALAGVPTFTIFGPQVPEWFAPLHPSAVWMEGKPCPYKPCSDYCRFSTALCLHGIGEEEAFYAAMDFIRRHVQPQVEGTSVEGIDVQGFRCK